MIQIKIHLIKLNELKASHLELLGTASGLNLMQTKHRRSGFGYIQNFTLLNI